MGTNQLTPKASMIVGIRSLPLLVFMLHCLIYATPFAIASEKSQPKTVETQTVPEIQIKRLPKSAASTLPTESFTPQKSHSPTDNEPLLKAYSSWEPLSVETCLDEIELPSQLLESCIRNAKCIPRKEVQPQRLKTLGSVIVRSKQRIGPDNILVVNFFDGVADKVSALKLWFSCSGVPTQTEMNLVKEQAPVGGTETDLHKYFHIDGGISPKSYQRYCWNQYKSDNGNALKINVELSEHRIKRCSLPYIEKAFFD